MSSDQLKKYKQHLQALDTEYVPWRQLYLDVRENFNPFAGWFPNDDGAMSFDPLKNDNRYNCEVTRAGRVFEAGMLQGMCSPSRPWLQMGSEDPDLDAYGPVKSYLDSLEKFLLTVFARSNFYTVQRTILGEQGWFGIGNFMPERIPNPPHVWYYHFPAGSYRLANGKNGKIDTCYRPIKMQARGMAFHFGKDKLSDSAKEACDKNPFSWFDVVHVIEPRLDDERDYGKIDNANMPFRSVWFEKGEIQKILRESGFPYFPCVVPRFIKIGHFPYGVGPGMDALKRAKMLHRMELDGLVGLHRHVRPPLAVPSRFKGVLDLTPDATNYVHDADTKDSILPILQTDIDWQHFQFRLDRIQGSVERAFMTDLFLMILDSDQEDPRRTATEVIKRHEEKMTVLGPVVENQIGENFDVCIDLTLRILFDVPGLIPPAPPELQGQPIKVKYISTLAQAQKMAEVGKINTYLDVAERVAQFDPKTLDATNGYKVLKEAEAAIGVPADILRGEDEYNQLLQQRMQQEQAAAEAAQMEQDAAIAKDLGGASTEQGTALGDIKQAVTQ